MQELQAIYEGGVLRPTEELHLEEHQLVRILVLDDEQKNGRPRLIPASEFEAHTSRTVDREALRAALSKIPGDMDADFAAERDERF